MWGVFEREDMVHVIPCDDEGVVLIPHIVGDLCSCRPNIIKVGEDGRIIFNHYEVH